jgi:Na+/H+ antiporter NhaD/arsenite permease-like protein
MIDSLLFALFAATLLGIARFHKQALTIAAAGLALVTLVRLLGTEFALGEHLLHEWRILVNLAGLLLGFAVLANFFERSHLPERLTEVLPAGRKGAFLLLVLVGCLSAVLDNIAAALIGGSAAITLFRRRVHLGYLAAIVACANAGGAGSVIGDTTTTMMWIEGASPLWVLEAFVGAAVAIGFCGFFASRQQNALQPLVRAEHAPPPLRLPPRGVVLLIIAGAIGANVVLDFPAAGVWAAIALGSLLCAPDLRVLPPALGGTLFLCCLVLTASMMPVKALPDPGLATTIGLGFVSAFFDNIPLTKLAIEQNGYDWGMLAFAVGYGGSMLWFGSSAGVAIASLFTEAKSAKQWLLQGWHVGVAYLLGMLVMWILFGWHAETLVRPGHTDQPPHAVDTHR